MKFSLSPESKVVIVNEVARSKTECAELYRIAAKERDVIQDEEFTLRIVGEPIIDKRGIIWFHLEGTRNGKPIQFGNANPFGFQQPPTFTENRRYEETDELSKSKREVIEFAENPRKAMEEEILATVRGYLTTKVKFDADTNDIQR